MAKKSEKGRRSKAKPAPRKRAPRKAMVSGKSVGVSIYGLAKFFRLVYVEEKAEALDSALMRTNKTVHMNYRTFKRMQDFARSAFDDHGPPGLESAGRVTARSAPASRTIAREFGDCDCKPGDPFCICFDHHRSFADS